MSDGKPVKLDLRNLTQAHIDEAMPHLGQCLYSAPCIIGTLIPEHQREKFDNLNGELEYIDDLPMISELVAQDLIEFPDDVQAGLAKTLQLAFDNKEYGQSRFAAAIEEVNRVLGLNLKVPETCDA